MNKKRVIILIVALCVLVGLATTGIILLARGSDKTATGSMNGTIGVNTVKKPDNLEDCEFGIAATVTTEGEYGTSIGGAIFYVKNGRNITFTQDAGQTVELSISRNFATSDYQTTQEAGWHSTDVFTMTLPTSMEWNLADVLSTVAWSDDYFDGHEIETNYYCGYVENCSGSYYTSRIQVHCKDTIEEHNYWFYSVSITVS